MAQEYGQLDYLVRRVEPERGEQKADFSDTEHHVSVTRYDDRTRYELRVPAGFDEIVDAVEPHFPINRRLELVKSDPAYFDPGTDHSFMSPEMVHDPVRDYQDEDRWSEYSMIQLNLTGMEVVWDDKGEPYEWPRVRIEEIDDEVDGFEKLFPEIVESPEADEIVEEIKEVV